MIDSLKVREKRGVRQKVVSKIFFVTLRTSKDYLNFLLLNKITFQTKNFTSLQVCQLFCCHFSCVYICKGSSVICKDSSMPMSSCDHEEADTLMCIHVHEKGTIVLFSADS